MKNFSRYMSEFVKSRDYYMNVIKKLNNKIEEKEFYPPLESLLIMKDPEILRYLIVFMHLKSIV